VPWRAIVTKPYCPMSAKASSKPPRSSSVNREDFVDNDPAWLRMELVFVCLEQSGGFPEFLYFVGVPDGI